MTATRDELIQEMFDTRLALALNGTNHDIYDKRLTLSPPRVGFDRVPRCIYFYYVRIDWDGKVRVDHYLYVARNAAGESIEIPYDDVPDLVFQLAKNGRTPTNPPKLSTSNFDDIPWEHWSYVAIFFDEANWAFHKRSDGKAAVVFDPTLGTPNHSFFDATDLVLDMPNQRTGGVDQRSAIFFVNHMKLNADGDDLPAAPAQKFKFDMWLDAKFSNASKTGMVVNFDPGGTNQGPPTNP